VQAWSFARPASCVTRGIPTLLVLVGVVAVAEGRAVLGRRHGFVLGGVGRRRVQAVVQALTLQDYPESSHQNCPQHKQALLMHCAVTGLPKTAL